MRRRTDPILRIPKILRGFGRRPLGFSLNPIAVVDFWEDPDIIYEEFDESYELNVAWDFFGDPDADETFLDWPDTGPVYDELTFEDYLVALDESYIAMDWPDVGPSYDSLSFNDGYVTINQNYEIADGWADPIATQPDGYSGITVWFDAQDNDSITLDGYGNIERWKNKGSRVLVDALQTDISLKPTPIDVDGYQFLDFDGSAKYLRMTVSGSNTPIYYNGLTCFAVFIADVISTNSATENSNAFLIGQGNVDWGITLRNTPDRVMGWVFSGGGYRATAWPINLSQPYVACVRLTPDYGYATTVNRVQISLDGYTFLDSPSGGIVAPSSNPLHIGVNGATSVYLNGKIGELIVYRGSLQNLAVKKVFRYLKNKWGIA